MSLEERKRSLERAEKFQDWIDDGIAKSEDRGTAILTPFGGINVVNLTRVFVAGPLAQLRIMYLEKKIEEIKRLGYDPADVSHYDGENPFKDGTFHNIM